MSIDPRELDAFLSQIKTEFNFTDLIANPFLSLVKPTEENLKKYRVFKPESRFWFGIKVAGVLPNIFFYTVYSAAVSVARFSENRHWNVRGIKKSRNLYISHFTYAQSPEKDDVFFGGNTKDSKDLVFYLNHTRENGIKTQNNYSCLGKLNVVVNTKSLGLIQTLILHKKQIGISLKFLSLALTNSSYNNFQRRLLLKISTSQHSRQTIANLCARARLREAVSYFRPENIILTIEGHAHEAMVIKLRDTDFPNVKILGYQHAPIVPGQFSFFRLLETFDSNDLILTCGKITSELISKSQPNSPVKILGSPKSIGTMPSLKNTTSMSVLGAVEGTYESLETFVNLFNGLSNLLPEIHFILRTHPALSKKVSQKLLKKLSRSINLEISTNTFFEDLINSHVTIFRSSAVGLEGLAFASFPVHFDVENNALLNPFSYINYSKIAFSNVSDLAEFLRSWPLTRNNTEGFRTESFEIIKDYYFPLLDINSLID